MKKLLVMLLLSVSCMQINSEDKAWKWAETIPSKGLLSVGKDVRDAAKAAGAWALTPALGTVRFARDSSCTVGGAALAVLGWHVWQHRGNLQNMAEYGQNSGQNSLYAGLKVDGSSLRFRAPKGLPTSGPSFSFSADKEGVACQASALGNLGVDAKVRYWTAAKAATGVAAVWGIRALVQYFAPSTL